MIDKSKYPNVTDRQWEAIEAVKAAGGNRTVAAAAMGVNHRNFQRLLERAAKNGYATVGMAPVGNPPGFITVKSTPMYDRDGNVVLEWRHNIPTAESVRAVFEALAKGLKGKWKRPTLPRKKQCQPLLVEVCLPDMHLGMLHREWSLQDSRDRILTAYDKVLFASAKEGKIEHCVVAFLGDQLHANDTSNRTPTNKHVLQTSASLEDVAEACATIMRHTVEQACLVARHVTLVIVPGNHDPEASMWLRIVASAMFGGARNVEVVGGERVYVRHGRTIIGYDHGHTIRSHNIPSVIDLDNPDISRESHPYRAFRLAHRHHLRRPPDEEVGGVVVEYLPAVSPRGRYDTALGFVGSRPRIMAATYDHAEGMTATHWRYV